MAKYFKLAKNRLRGGHSIWTNGSIVANKEFFGSDLGGNTYDEVLNFNSENIFTLSNTIDFECLLSLEGNNEVIINEILEINELVGFNNESQINSNSFIRIEQSITISSNSDISSLPNLQINENLAFNTDSIFSDSNNSSLSNQTVFLTDNNIEFSVSKLAELFTQLISIGNINIDNEAAYLNKVELSTNNDSVFSLFIEAYNNILFYKNAGIQFDALSIIESTFGLSSNSNIKIESNNANFNNLNFLINANFFVVGEKVFVDYSNFEKVIFNNKSSQKESFNMKSYEMLKYENLESIDIKKFNLKSLS